MSVVKGMKIDNDFITCFIYFMGVLGKRWCIESFIDY